jgi:hypothetical protein
LLGEAAAEDILQVPTMVAVEVLEDIELEL